MEGLASLFCHRIYDHNSLYTYIMPVRPLQYGQLLSFTAFSYNLSKSDLSCVVNLERSLCEEAPYSTVQNVDGGVVVFSRRVYSTSAETVTHSEYHLSCVSHILHHMVGFHLSISINLCVEEN